MATDPELYRVLGEISSDVKHILVRQDKQDLRIDKIQTKLTASLAEPALEIQAIAPEIVTPAPFDVLADEHIEGKFTSKTGEDYLTVDYSKLVPLLIEAIKEQDGTINSLRNDVETLKDLVNKLIGPK